MEPNYYITLGLLLVIAHSLYELFSLARTNKELYRDLAISRDKVQELEVKLHNMGKPQSHTTWQHTNGNIYEVIGYTNMHSTNLTKYPLTIVYKGENGNIWSRPLSDWHRSFTAYEPLEGKPND